MIDRGDIRPGNRPLQQYLGLHCRALVMVSSGIRLTAWLQNSKKRAERSERLMCKPRVTAIISLWIICIAVCCRRKRVNHYRDNAITYKAQRGEMPGRAGERGNYWHADASAWCCCARCKIHMKELADAKAENDALRDDVAAGRRRLHIKAVCQSVREATTASAWIMQPPRLAVTRWTGLFRLKREADTMQQLEDSILMSSADRVAHIDGQLMQLLWAIHTRFQRSINAKSNKTEQSILRMLLGFCFNNIFCAATNFGCIVFLLPNWNEEMMGDGFLWCYCCRFVLNSKRLLSTSCNKQNQRSSSSIFMSVIPDAFLKFAESYV